MKQIFESQSGNIFFVIIPILIHLLLSFMNYDFFNLLLLWKNNFETCYKK